MLLKINSLIFGAHCNFAQTRYVMKKLLLLVAAMFFSISASASHLLGGQLWYEYVSTSFNDVTFKVGAGSGPDIMPYCSACPIAAESNREVLIC